MFLKSILSLVVIISLGVPSCSDNGIYDRQFVDDKECCILYKKDAVAIDIEFVQCCALVDEEDLNGEEELDLCIVEADGAGDENFHEFENCPLDGSCLDKCHNCLDDCDRHKEDCADNCLGEIGRLFCVVRFEMYRKMRRNQRRLLV